MKNLLGLLFLSIMICSCGKDLAEDVIGTWNAKTQTFTNCTDPLDNQSLVFDDMGCVTEDEVSLCTSFEITATGGFNTTTTISSGMSSFTETDPGAYVLDGDNVTITVDGATSTGTVSISGDTMTIIGTDADGCDFTVTALRAS